MRLNRHIFAAAFLFGLSVSVFGSPKRPAPCDLALAIIDNESGEAVSSPELLLFTDGGKAVLKSRAVDGKIVFNGLKNGEFGVMTTSDGYKNSFFRISIDCASLGDGNRKDVILPLWKGEDTKTMVLEFDEGAGHLKLKNLGFKGPGAEEGTAPTRITKGVVNGVATRLYRPEYPAVARAMGERGAVQVKVTIWYDGTVRNVEALSGPPRLREAAEEAARRSEFRPTFLEGIPIKVEGTIVYVFN